MIVTTDSRATRFFPPNRAPLRRDSYRLSDLNVRFKGRESGVRSSIRCRVIAEKARRISQLMTTLHREVKT